MARLVWDNLELDKIKWINPEGVVLPRSLIFILFTDEVVFNIN